MTAKDALKRAMKARKVTQSVLAEQIGKNQNNVSMYLHSDLNMKVANMVQMANACGYEVVLVDREDPKTMYVVGERDELGPGDENFDERVREIVAEELAKRT